MGDSRDELELARSLIVDGQLDRAEKVLWRARAAIADNEGTDSAQWGVATLYLADCALRRGEHPTAARRGLNAIRALEAAGSPGSMLPAADATLIVGEALLSQGCIAAATLYLERASRDAHEMPGGVRISSRADVQLSSAYAESGRTEMAAEAAMRAWATIEDEESALRGAESVAAGWVIRRLEAADRLMDALPVWEWLFGRGPADEDWTRIHWFVRRMAEQGLEQEAIEFFRGIEELDAKRMARDDVL